MVAEPPVPTSVAFPAFVPDVMIATTQELEVVQVAEEVTFFEVLSEYAACAVKLCCSLLVSVGEFGVTVTEEGEFTKNPLQPTAKASTANAANKAIDRSFRSELNIL